MTGPQVITWMKRNPIPVGAGLLSLALAATIFLRSDLVPEANATLDAKSTEARRYDLNLTNSTQLKEHYEAMAGATKEIESRLIRPSQLGINQQYFYRLESEYGVKLSELRQDSRTQSQGSFIAVPFALTVQGDFPAVVGFVQGLENGAHYCRVLSASCTADRTGPVTLVLNLELLGQP